MAGSVVSGASDPDLEAAKETGRSSEDKDEPHETEKNGISYGLKIAIRCSEIHSNCKDSDEDILTPLEKEDKFNTALHYAVQNKNIECLNYLLRLTEVKKSSHFINLPNSDGDTALHLAVKDYSMEIIGHLQEAGSNINLRDDSGNTPLHLLASFLCQERLDMKPFLDCFSKWKDIDWDPLNFDKKTPLQVAAESLRQSQTYRTQIEEFCIFLIERNAKVPDEVKGLLSGINVNAIGKIQGDNIASSQSKMFNYIIQGDVWKVKSILDLENNDGKFKAKEAINDFIGSKTIVYHVVDQNNLEVVKYLLGDLKAECNKKNVNGKEPLHQALVMKNLDLTKSILEHLKKKPTFDTIHLEKILEVDEKGPGECLKFLRELLKSNLFSDISDDALDVAHERNFPEAIVLLISYGAYIGDDHGNVKKCIRNEHLIQAFDEIMMQSLNKKDTNTLSQKHKVELNYKFLYSTKAIQKCNELSILHSIQEEFELEKILKHPLMQVYLSVMWRNMKKYHIGSIFLHILIIFFTFMSINNYYFITLISWIPTVYFNSTGNYTYYEYEENYSDYKGEPAPFSITLLFLAVFLEWKLLIQFEVIRSLVRESKNLEDKLKEIFYKFLDLEWIILVSCLVVGFEAINPSEESEEFINHFSAWIMVAASFVAFWKMGRMPYFSFYIYFMAKVTRNFLKLLFPVLIVFFAFAASFYSVFKTRTEPEESDELTDFSNIWRSIARTFVMSTGEFEYSNYSQGQEEISTLAFISSVLLFLLFIFLLAIVLMNVLTGLAVNDAEVNSL